eukprot:SAG31_NODE_4516_length_3172_cov_1.397332_1_plen_238_part_00
MFLCSYVLMFLCSYVLMFLCYYQVPSLLLLGVLLCFVLKLPFLLTGLVKMDTKKGVRGCLLDVFLDVLMEMLPEAVLGFVYAVYMRYEAACKWEGRQDYKKVSLSVNIFSPKLTVADADTVLQGQQYSMLVRTVSENTLDVVRHATVDRIVSGLSVAEHATLAAGTAKSVRAVCSRRSCRPDNRGVSVSSAERIRQWHNRSNQRVRELDLVSMWVGILENGERVALHRASIFICPHF